MELPRARHFNVVERERTKEKGGGGSKNADGRFYHATTLPPPLPFAEIVRNLSGIAVESGSLSLVSRFLNIKCC